MQLHVMHSVTKVVHHCSVCATAVVVSNAISSSLSPMQQSRNSSKLPAASQPSLHKSGLLAYHDLQVKAFSTIL